MRISCSLGQRILRSWAALILSSSLSLSVVVVVGSPGRSFKWFCSTRVAKTGRRRRRPSRASVPTLLPDEEAETDDRTSAVYSLRNKEKLRVHSLWLLHSPALQIRHSTFSFSSHSQVAEIGSQLSFHPLQPSSLLLLSCVYRRSSEKELE